MKKLILSVLFVTSAIAGEYKLIGTHLLEVTMFGIDVYKASYYKDADNNKILLQYLRDVEKKYTVEGWEKGLVKYDSNEEKEARKWLVKTSGDIKEGDVLELIQEENKLKIVLNGKVTHQSDDNLIAKLALAPWIGKYPAKEEMKKDLLGK
jgi:hypothetical protein